MAATVDSASVAPGICTRIELDPCCWTLASFAPRELTRCCTIWVAVAMSSELGVPPSEVVAVMMTETPPRMSRPCVIFSPRGVKPKTQTPSATSRTTSVVR